MGGTEGKRGSEEEDKERGNSKQITKMMKELQKRANREGERGRVGGREGVERENRREGGGAKKRTRKEGRVLKMSQKLNTEYRGVNIYETTPEKGQRSILQKGRRGQHKVN